ncbi:MAG TPA: DUF5666 domain-containing protein [Acidimicrobiales bacterium]|nr:DUF5666 domain-containing protein [Acidimicrobiales bacterium]
MARPVAKLRTSVLVAAAGLGLLAASTLAGCGGSTSKTSGSPTTTAPARSSSSNNNNNSGGNPRTFPGASGSVAAITGRSMEVQSQQNGQTTVSWTSATTFSETVTVTASSIAVGDCVTASGTSNNGTITARTVSVSKPVSGSCSAGRPGGFGGFGGGAAGGRFRGGHGTPPGGSSRSRPSGAFRFASGKVTAVSSSKLVLSGFSSSPGTRRKATTVDVATSSSTTYSRRETVASSKLAVGDCVTALGKADSTGAVKATTVQITSTGHKSCTTGFGGFGASRTGSPSGNSSNG